MINICEKHTLSNEGKGLIFNEPYLPYFPEGYTDVLAVAEAQNFGGINNEYVKLLSEMSPVQRMDRLKISKETEGHIRIKPWMDGSIPMAIECGLSINPNDVAVSNSVLWSRVSVDGANRNPNKYIIDKSRLFWKDLLPKIKCHTIITLGSIARDVFSFAENVKIINLKSSSPISMGIYCRSVPSPMPGKFKIVIDEMKLKYPQYFNKNSRFKEAFLYHVLTTVAQ